MKAALNLSCEFDEIPITIGDFLSLLQTRKWKTVEDLLQAAQSDCYSGKNMIALATIDDIRKLLTQIDGSLLDYSSILNGYIKAEADLKAGIEPSQSAPEIEIDGTEEQPESD
jgi:hypothetical protein